MTGAEAKYYKDVGRIADALERLAPRETVIRTSEPKPRSPVQVEVFEDDCDVLFAVLDVSLPAFDENQIPHGTSDVRELMARFQRASAECERRRETYR